MVEVFQAHVPATLPNQFLLSATALVGVEIILRGRFFMGQEE